MKVKTYCPVFSGFYGTVFEPDETQAIYDFNEDRKEGTPEYNYESFDIDYSGYRKDVARTIVPYISHELKKEIPGFLDMKMEKLVSPREYNFYNDSIDVVVKLNKKKFREWLLSYIEENAKEWEAYLKSRYTSYDGFYSSYPNTAEGWRIDTKDYTELDGHYLGTILEFYCTNVITEMDLVEYVSGNGVYIDSYMKVK